MTFFKLVPFLKLLRPNQWFKNVFVMGPLFFSLNFLNIEMLKNSLVAVLCFIAASSLTYIFNDLHDVEEDRHHPIKKNRPIASQLIPVKPCIIIGTFILLALYTALITQLNEYCVIVITTYLIIQVFYTLKFKYIIILDCIIIASGFVLRVILGGYAINVSVSTWIIITTFFLSLFLAFGKRYHEYQFTNYIKIRYPLNQYRKDFLIYLISITCTCSIVMYGLFLVETSHNNNNQNLIYTLVFVIFGLFRYLQFLFINKQGGEPEIIFYKDMPFLLNTISWAILTLWILY